jgi:hypothetical protein
VSLRDLREACKNRYVRSYFERRFCKANHPEALCFRDAAAEDSGAKYFLAMLKYRCNPADPEAMALLQEINSGPSPLDDRWKNPNLRWLHYLVK